MLFSDLQTKLEGKHVTIWNLLPPWRLQVTLIPHTVDTHDKIGPCECVQAAHMCVCWLNMKKQ